VHPSDKAAFTKPTPERGLAPALPTYNTILLFSESPTRFLVEVAPTQQDAFEAHLHANGVQDFACIGTVNETERFVVHNGDQLLIDIPVGELQAAWEGEQA